jgi:uncharacterized protein (DUF58 family)
MSHDAQEIQEVLKKIRKIEIKTKGLSAQIFSGGYRTSFKGRGMLFSEVRPYQYGDDVRNIDWNVTARTREPYIKVFEEERELTFMLLIDISGSVFFGTQNQQKLEYATEIAASLAFSASNNNDMVGAIFYSDEVELYIPPKKGKAHILRIIREMLYLQPKSKGSNLAPACKYLTNIITKRCTAFVLSDFLNQNFDDALKIAAKRHDLIGIRVFDPHEQHLPEVGWLPLLDAETGEIIWTDTNSPAVRAAHSKFYENNIEYFRQSFWKNGADTVSISTQESYVKALLQFFRSR